MVVLPIAAVILSNVLGRGHTTVFWVEFAAMWVFGIYWLAKSAELHKTRSDRSVMRAWADS